MRIHVRYGAGEAVFNVEPMVELRESVGLKVRELAHAESLARTYRTLIIQIERPAWVGKVRPQKNGR